MDQQHLHNHFMHRQNTSLNRTKEQKTSTWPLLLSIPQKHCINTKVLIKMHSDGLAAFPKNRNQTHLQAGVTHSLSNRQLSRQPLTLIPCQRSEQWERFLTWKLLQVAAGTARYFPFSTLEEEITPWTVIIQYSSAFCQGLNWEEKQLGHLFCARSI